jgi:hypothetical protein
MIINQRALRMFEIFQCQIIDQIAERHALHPFFVVEGNVGFQELLLEPRQIGFWSAIGISLRADGGKKPNHRVMYIVIVGYTPSQFSFVLGHQFLLS